MDKKSILDIPLSDLENKRVLVRVDFNVPMSESGISDDTRIRASLSTIRYLTDAKAKVILLSHMGRPKGKVVDEFRLTPIARRLSELLAKPVVCTSDCIGDEVSRTVESMKPGDVILLENVRFHREETQNDPDFAKELASLGDMFVHDAFGAAHRAHASSHGIAAYLPAYAGLLLKKEITVLSSALNKPKRPFVAIIGGAKISTKLGVLKHLLDKVDTLIIGGGMTFTLLKAQGYEIGKSLCEDSEIDNARTFLGAANNSKTTVILPVDQVVVPKFDNDAPRTVVDSSAIPNDQLGVDIGPKTIALVQEVVAKAQTIIWNGPLGVFELSNFANGTFEIAKALAGSDATTIIGGGDSAAAIAKCELSDQMSHISTGGGAALEFLEGIVLPGLDILEDNNE